MQKTATCRIVVLISGNGSNLQAIIDQIKTGLIPAKIVAVISNKANAYGLQRAKSSGIATEVIGNNDFKDRAEYDSALAQCIDAYQPDLVVLAGFMRILTTEFVNRYHRRMLNIHPSLLPKFKGLRTHQRALDAEESEHGASVHFVTPELDGGPVVVQSTTKILQNDSAQSLAKRVHAIEHTIYPLVISWFALGRIAFAGEQLLLDGKPLQQPILIE